MDLRRLFFVLVMVGLSRGHPECLTRDADLPGYLPPLESYGLSSKFTAQSAMFTRSIPVQYHIVEPSGAGSITDYSAKKDDYKSAWAAAIDTHLAEYNKGFAKWGASFHLQGVNYIPSSSLLHNCYGAVEASLEPELQKHNVNCSTQYADWPTCGTINVYLNEGSGGIMRLQVLPCSVPVAPCQRGLIG